MKKRTTFPFLLLLVSILGLSLPQHARAAAAPKPNVLFIVVDDMNAWTLKDLYPVLKVPAFKKLVSQSYHFTNATCAGAICVPSRAAFFSGKYPHHTGVYTNGPDVWDVSKVLPGVEAIPELFKRSGYTTWAGGKTFHVALGNGREEAMWSNAVEHGGYGPFASGRANWNDIKPWTGPDKDFTDVRTADNATAFLSQKHDKPFFMYLGLYRPHSPYTAPKRFHDLYEGVNFPMVPGYQENDLDDVPAAGKALSSGMEGQMKNGKGLQEYLKAYCANTSFADWNVGRVLEALDKSSYAKNTIVVFISDNGFHNGTKDHWAKKTLWEQADNIPFLIRLPEGKGYKCEQTVNTVDIYPTLVEYCGLGAPKHQLDGQSIMPLLRNPKAKWSRPGLTSVGEKYASVRSERYRYIRYPDGSEELYDHDQDPYEHKNLAGEPKLAKVKAELGKSVPASFQKSVPTKKEAKKGEAAQQAAPKKKGGKKGGNKKAGDKKAGK